MKISAIVVTYNEATRLQQCLASLSFCDQLIVIDLGSEDDSIEIARNFTDEVHKHEHVPIVEMIWSEAVTLCRNDWVVRLDPDEVFSPVLGQYIKTMKISDQVGMLKLPHQFYFLGRPLHTTIWGGIHYKPTIFHRDRVQIKPIVHRGLKSLPGFIDETIRYTGDNEIKHFWVDTLGQLLEKHLRYLGQEGKSKYEAGERFSLRKMFYDSSRYLYRNLIKFSGWRGGLLGIFLSFFYTWYIVMSWLALRKYQKTIL